MVYSANGSVWDVAVAELRKKKGREDFEDASSNSDHREATIVFTGSREAGKSTLIQKFLDKAENLKTTIALEYTYCKKGARTLVKDLCHLWELGGGSLFSSLLSTPINIRTIHNLTIFIVLDLSKPEILWNDLENLLKAIKEKVNNVVDSKEGEELRLRERLTDAAWERVGKEHQDKDHLNPSLIPLVIIGSKYDVFQDYSPEEKKIICRTLRFVAHINGAHLQYFSCHDPGQIKKAKEVMSHHGFGTAASNSLAQDFNKPLLIPAGSDSMQILSGNLEESQTNTTIETWKHIYTAKFPQINEERKVIGEDPTKDPKYAEPDIDNLRAHKDLKLERLQKEMRSRAKFGDLDLSTLDQN